MPIDFHAIIVGGGPAGSACAIQLARAAARVAIVEASDFSRFRIGETLEPSAGPLLRRLGIEPDDRSDFAVRCDGVSAAWGQPRAAHRPSILEPLGHGWRVDRRRFDRAMFELARGAGAVTYERGRLASVMRRSGIWELTIATPGGPVQGRAVWIVTATGRSAAAAPAPRQRLYLDRLIGIAAIRPASMRHAGNFLNRALVEAGPFGWWYSAIVPDRRRLQIFFTDSDLLPKGRGRLDGFLREQLALGPLTRVEYGSPDEDSAPLRWTGFNARSGIGRVALSDGWIATGDAAMSFDPLCGRGVTEALSSGCEVANWLLQAARPNSDAIPPWIAGAADRFNAYRTQRSQIYSQEARWTALPFWQRRRQAKNLALER